MEWNCFWGEAVLWYSVLSKTFQVEVAWLFTKKKHDEAIWWSAPSVLVCFPRMNEQTSNHRLKAYLVGSSWNGTDTPLNCTGLRVSDENITRKFICHVKRLHTASEGHYSNPTDYDEGQWSLWWLRAAPKDFAELAQYQPKPMSLSPPSFLPHLCSVPNQNGDKTIMTQLAFAQPSWVEMKLIWKSCIGPGWNRRDYCADCTNTVSQSSPLHPTLILPIILFSLPSVSVYFPWWGLFAVVIPF